MREQKHIVPTQHRAVAFMIRVVRWACHIDSDAIRHILQQLPEVLWSAAEVCAKRYKKHAKFGTARCGPCHFSIYTRFSMTDQHLLNARTHLPPP